MSKHFIPIVLIILGTYLMYSYNYMSFNPNDFVDIDKDGNVYANYRGLQIYLTLIFIFAYFVIQSIKGQK